MLRLSVLIVAGVLLHHQLAGLHRAELAAAFRRYDISRIAIAVLCTAASFSMLGLVEMLALRYAGGAARAVPRRVALATGFVAHALSQSIGLGLLTGAAVRLRAYAGYHIDAATVARTSVFASATTLLGLFSLGSIALLTTPDFSPVARTRVAAQGLGAAFAAVVIAYLAWCALGRDRAIGVGQWRIGHPSSALAALQLLLSIGDWLVTGAMLFTLLAHGTSASFTGFLGAYLVAHAAGIASHVPGGAGVFEVAFLALMAPGAMNPGRAGVVASLLAYRVLYYFLPLCAAAALATMSELRRRHSVASTTSSAPELSANTSATDSTW